MLLRLIILRVWIVFQVLEVLRTDISSSIVDWIRIRQVESWLQACSIVFLDQLVSWSSFETTVELKLDCRFVGLFMMSYLTTDQAARKSPKRLLQGTVSGKFSSKISSTEHKSHLTGWRLLTIIKGVSRNDMERRICSIPNQWHVQTIDFKKKQQQPTGMGRDWPTSLLRFILIAPLWPPVKKPQCGMWPWMCCAWHFTKSLASVQRNFLWLWY